MEDRFEDLPETFNEMMLLPNMPDFCPSHGNSTKVHQIITASGTLLKKEKNTCTKGWTIRVNSTRRHVNSPWGIMQNEVVLPLGGLLMFPTNGKGSNNSPPPLIVTMTPLGYMAPRSKGTWYFPEVYGIIAKTVQCLSMHCNSLQYLHL